METGRCFAHVDQALFAVERHCEHTIVFDCGGETKFIVENAIDDVLRRIEVIDILFISHYDSDHINGIQHLLQTHNVRHIVLPMIAEPVKALICKINEDEGYPEVSAFARDPEKEIRGYIESAPAEIRENSPLIHFVSPWDEMTNKDLRYDENEGYPRVRDIDELEGENIPAGVALTIGAVNEDCNRCKGKGIDKCRCRWIYLPFNRCLMTTTAETAFWKELNMPTNTKCDDVLQNWGNIHKDIKEAWAKATGIKEAYINKYSMTLYTGCRECGHFSACLFTGDYKAKAYMKELYEAYKMLWSNICVMQIPHHGSEEFFHEDLIIHHGVHIVSNRNQPKTKRKVNDTIVINKILSRGEIVAKTSHQNINIPEEVYRKPFWNENECWYCRKCRCW